MYADRSSDRSAPPSCSCLEAADLQAGEQVLSVSTICIMSHGGYVMVTIATWTSGDRRYLARVDSVSAMPCTEELRCCSGTCVRVPAPPFQCQGFLLFVVSMFSYPLVSVKFFFPPPSFFKNYFFKKYFLKKDEGGKKNLRRHVTSRFS